MTAEPVLMLTPSCPLLSPTRLSCVGCCLRHISLCSVLCVCVFSFFFVFLPPPPLLSQEHRLQARKNANIVLVRSGMEIGDGLASVCTCGCWQASRAAPGSRVELERPHLLPFQTATCSCRRTGPCLFPFLLQMI